MLVYQRVLCPWKLVSWWFPVVPGIPFARWYLDHKDMDQQAQWATEFLAWYGFAFYLLQAGWDPQKGDPHGDKGRSPRPWCVFCWGESFGETLLEPQYDISHLLSNWAPFVQPALRLWNAFVTSVISLLFLLATAPVHPVEFHHLQGFFKLWPATIRVKCWDCWGGQGDFCSNRHVYYDL